MSGTEDSILNNIPDFQNEGTDETAGQSTPSQGGDTQGSSNDGRSSAQPTGTDSTSSGVDQSQQRVVRRHDGLIEQPNPDNPRTRDLVDPVSGRIVAQGGIERRVFEEAQRQSRENNALRQQVTGLQNAVRASNATIQEAARLNVAPQDQLVAIRVMADFMRDPVRTLEGLVAEVRSKGYQLPFLQQGVSPGMDMDAIGRLIDNRLAPITGRHQQEQQVEQFRQQAQRDLDTFIGENPEANQNLDVLTEMLQAQPGLPLGQAWMKMVRWSHENGLDWTQPLKQQIAALRQQQTTQPVQPQNQPRPIPGRRSASQAGAVRTNGAGGAQQFNENASWADIIRSAMQDSGVQLN